MLEIAKKNLLVIIHVPRLFIHDIVQLWLGLINLRIGLAELGIGISLQITCLSHRLSVLARASVLVYFLVAGSRL